MKFSNVLLFTTAVLAAPAVVEKRSQTSVVQTIVKAANQLDTTVQTSVASVNNIISTVSNNVGAQFNLVLQAALKANINNIITAVHTASTAILGGVTSLLTGTLGDLDDLSKDDLAALSQALSTTVNALGSIKSLIANIKTDLPAALQLLIKNELTTISGSIGPLIAPLTSFVSSLVSSIKGGGTGVGTNLGDVLESVGNLLGTLLRSLLGPF